MKRVLQITTLIISLIIVLSSCSSNSKQGNRADQKEIYIEFDGGKITKADYNAFIHSLPGEQQEALNMAGQQVKLLNSMANEEAFYCESKRLGHDKNPEVLALIENRLKPFYINDFYNENIRSKATATEEEVASFYEDNQDFFLQPSTATIRYIQAADLESAQDILKDLEEKGIDFKIVSRVKSINDYAKGNDGIIREINNNGYVQGVGEDEELNTLIFSMPISSDEFYGPYETKTGVHIFSILNRVEAYVKPFAEVKDVAQTRTLALSQKKISDDLINKVKSELKITIDKEALNSIDFVDTSNNPETLLQKPVLNSKSKEFTWSVEKLIENYNAIEKNERRFISQSTQEEILDHILAKEVYYYKLKKDGYDKELNKTLKYSRNIRNLILSYTYQKLVADQIVITDEMMQDYYKNNMIDFSKPAYRNIEMLVFDSYEKAENASIKYVSAVNKEDNAEIEKIMQTYASNDFDKRLINNVYSNGIVPGYGKDTVLNSSIWILPVNEVSDILTLKRNDKPVIFRVISEEPIQYKPLNHVEPQIEGKLKREKSTALFDSLLVEFKEKFNFVIYEDKLKPTLTSEQLFDLAEKQAKMGKYNDTILYYDQIIGSFDNNKDDYKAMFMKGFTQSEYMNDKQAAIETFTKFLKIYPEGDLNTDAQVMLDILTGKTTIDILDEVEFED